jgi:hypothetical protein
MSTLSDAFVALPDGKFGLSPRPDSINDFNETDVCFFLLYRSSSFSKAGVIEEKFRRLSK